MNPYDHLNECDPQASPTFSSPLHYPTQQRKLK